MEKIINDAWENRAKIDGNSDKSILDAITTTIEKVDKGEIRVAEKKGDEWVVHQWIKKAILLSFKTNEMQTLAGPYATWWDKVKGKTAGWGRAEFKEANFRMVPNGVVRHGSYIAKNLEPAYHMGMKTAWIENDDPYCKKGFDGNHVNYTVKNLTEFLKQTNNLIGK